MQRRARPPTCKTNRHQVKQNKLYAVSSEPQNKFDSNATVLRRASGIRNALDGKHKTPSFPLFPINAGLEFPDTQTTQGGMVEVVIHEDLSQYVPTWGSPQGELAWLPATRGQDEENVLYSTIIRSINIYIYI